ALPRRAAPGPPGEAPDGRSLLTPRGRPAGRTAVGRPASRAAGTTTGAARRSPRAAPDRLRASGLAGGTRAAVGLAADRPRGPTLLPPGSGDGRGAGAGP